MSQENNSVVSSHHDASFRDDEINLFDLLTDLQIQKRFIIVPIVCCVLLAVAYVSLVKPIYQVVSVVKEASEGDLVELNAPQLRGDNPQLKIEELDDKDSGKDGENVSVKDPTEIFSLTVEDAYRNATQSLLSREYRRKFYQVNLDKIKGINLYNYSLNVAQNFNAFNRLFSVKLSNPKRDVENFIELKLDLVDAELAAELMNGYVAFALNSRLENIQNTLANKLAARIESLEYDASLIREQYYAGKTYRKLELEEAVQIAKEIGQVDSIFSRSGVLNGTADLPLYLYGSKALAAEKTVLNNRGKVTKKLPYGEEHFIEGLPDILFKIQQLKSLDIDFNKVNIAKVDEYAVVPTRPIKPRKALILALGLIAGGFLGLITALLVAAYKRHKKQHDLVESEAL